MEFDVTRKTEQELREKIGGMNPGTDFRVACEIELDRRKRWKDFWTKGIVAWVALLIALASLIWQIVKELL
ncbi:MAG: hypothetical protein A2V65_01620 [Deltaproteobacteria bacterium RBG_13_49_15]|nr:MAG: hypothetical protein A2V65_01620 [Deltaproteobacteria bacterium RBG_13_49_15]